MQPQKAELPILVTDSGIVTEAKPLNPEHKSDGIISTLSPNVMVIIGQLVNGEPSDEQLRAFHMTEVKPVQPLNAELPITDTDSGIVTEVKPVQPEKAEPPILVTDEGIVTEAKPLNPEHKSDGIFSTLSPNVMVLIGQLVNGEPFDEQFRAFHVTEVKPVQPEKAEP